MSEKPIIFNRKMVKAILDGQKTQTRRVIKPQLPNHIDKWSECEWFNLSKSPYGKYGDRLWVRETFAIECNDGCQDVYSKPENPLGKVRWHKDRDGCQYFECARYRASEPDTILGEKEDGMKWKPSIHMPRWANRIMLEIIDVRVERVQDISYKDVVSEGIKPVKTDSTGYINKDTTIQKFKELWDSINIDRGYSWNRNPWVWVIEFKKV